MQQLFKAKQAEMVACLLSSRQISHAGEMGGATEENWRELLKAYLPGRYAVEGGFIIDVDGRESQQLDLIIFDRQYSPVLFEAGGVRYVPAESVYGVFEIKQDLNKQHVEYAGEKVASARRLKRTSAPIVHAGGEYSPKEPTTILGGILTAISGWSPPFGGPLTKALETLDEEQQLNIGCALQSGAFTVDRRGGTVLGYEWPGRLVPSLLRLLVTGYVAANGHCSSDGLRAMAEGYVVARLGPSV